MNWLMEIYIKVYRWMFPKMPREVFYECRKDLELFEKLCRENIMTEKRFYLLNYNNYPIYDSLNDKEYNAQFKAQREKLCLLLNELSEENQSSKEFIEQLQEELVLFKEAGANIGIDLNAQITALKQENEKLKNKLKFFYELNKPYGDIIKENEQLKQQNKMLRTNVGKLTDDVKYLRNLPSTHQKENKQLKEENKELKKEDELFFGQVFDILLKYQDLFNREMADEVLEELGIELTRWFE